MMQTGLAFAHRLARFGPNFRFHAAAADGAGRLSIFKEEHLRAAPLRGRATRMCDRGDHYALAARVRFANQSKEIVLCNRTHKLVAWTSVCSPSPFGSGSGR